MKKLVIGILAHVDAGKTTLAESILYLAGKIGKPGRVDNKDAYLDTGEIERARGITIFSKQAVFETEGMQITLLDTPGHTDFSAEMERALQVLDYAILVINGADGIQGHTKTLWRLLDIYQVPAFLFVNKMDQAGTDQGRLQEEIKAQLSDGCVYFGDSGTDSFYDQLAMCDERMMEEYLQTGCIETVQIQRAIKECKVFPCFFGSALRSEGVRQLLQGIVRYGEAPRYPDEFGAKIFKVTRDEQGVRLTHLKLTGGKLKVKNVLTNGVWEEKVNQIRIYSGERFEAVNEAEAGDLCAVTGLSMSKPGEGLGIEEASGEPVLEPVLSYQMILPADCDPRVMMPKLRLLQEEQPELNILWDEQLQEIQVRLMGEVQIEILQSLIQSRFGVSVTFGDGKIVYKETITEEAEGVGHFEPLRHYAEVHLLLEPGAPGSGLRFGTNCSEDLLGKNWQRHILSCLKEKSHKGVLTGSAITDIKITLVSGRAHNKHTEGGDFREAACRGVRQGLKEAESILLEPYYAFQLELPEQMVGRAMSDVEKMRGTCEIQCTNGETTVLTGSAPVSAMRNYQREVLTWTKGLGRLFCSLKGYGQCHNAQEIVENIGYDSERDVENPTGSIFCTHGAGFFVEWHEVKDYMHVESYLKNRGDFSGETAQTYDFDSGERSISLEEIDRIMSNTYYANQGKKSGWKRGKTARESYYETVTYTGASRRQEEPKEEYLLVDGYNIIYAWPELKELADANMDGARTKLLDVLSNYQGIRKCRIIAVFDAYRLQGHPEEVSDYDNIRVVYTKEAQTADQYIERFAYDNQKKYDITVATSDGLQQMIVRGSGGLLLSARDLKDDIERVNEKLRQELSEKQVKDRSYLVDALPDSTQRKVEEFMNKDMP